MSENKIQLRVLTPTGKLYDDFADMVILRGENGDLGVLKGHQPLNTTLSYSLLNIKKDNKTLLSTLFGGFANIQPHCVTILTDSAEWIEDIDIHRAQESKKRAEERLKNKTENIDEKRAELSLKRAVLRINQVNHKSKGI